MKIEINTTSVLEVNFDQFKVFYPLFNAGEKVLWYKEKDDEFLLLAFVDNACPMMCRVSKKKILEDADLPDDFPETTELAVNNWKMTYLGGQNPKMGAYPFIKYGDIE